MTSLHLKWYKKNLGLEGYWYIKKYSVGLSSCCKSDTPYTKGPDHTSCVTLTPEKCSKNKLKTYHPLTKTKLTVVPIKPEKYFLLKENKLSIKADESTGLCFSHSSEFEVHQNLIWLFLLYSHVTKKKIIPWCVQVGKWSGTQHVTGGVCVSLFSSLPVYIFKSYSDVK